MDERINQLFNELPIKLRGQLLEEFYKIHKNYLYRNYEPVGLNAAKFCEVVYCIIKNHTNKTYPEEAEAPKDMIGSCRQLESNATINVQSFRTIMPRALTVLYEIRNKRKIGHINGDVNPNFMDATLSIKIVDWIMAELIRVFHSITTEDAQSIIDQLMSSDSMPIIWDINSRQRILLPGLSKFEETAVILYKNHSRHDKELYLDIGYSNFSVFKKQILHEGHEKHLWEYNEKNGLITISPKGTAYAEEIVQKNYKN